MKTLIIYKSNTGFTKQYAEFIKERIADAKLIDIRHLKKNDIKESDFIFYGGPLRNNVILGLNKFLKHHKLFENKDIFIFGVGIQPVDNDKRENVINANGLSFYHVRLYLFTGGMDFTKMSKFKKKIFKFGIEQAASKGELPNGATAAQAEMMLERRIDMVSRSQIDKMMSVYTILLGRKINS